jgi:hypothetical protein
VLLERLPAPCSRPQNYRSRWRNREQFTLRERLSLSVRGPMRDANGVQAALGSSNGKCHTCGIAVYYEVVRFMPTTPQLPEAGGERHPPVVQMRKRFLSSFESSKATG